MSERVLANGSACITCAARTLASEGGAVCEPWKLGSSNNNTRKHKRFVYGRTHTSGTTMRPRACPHPESTVPSTPSVQSLLRAKLTKK